MRFCGGRIHGRAYKSFAYLAANGSWRYAGPAELIDNGINGYLIEEGNEREFSEKLLELLLDEKLRKKFSENSRKDLDRFNIEKIIEKWNRLIVTL